jgi:hypothetical protein
MRTNPDTALNDTRRWLERAVIGLNLCPFAKAVLAKGQIHFAHSAATDWPDLLSDLAQAVDALVACDPQERDTTLLVAPDALPDFFEFNAFLAEAERWLEQRRLRGVLQLAHFHPRFEFASHDPQDPAHCTNRAPYPTLHLLRESSIDRAVQAYPDPSAIYEANIATLRRLGHGGWSEVMAAP